MLEASRTTDGAEQFGVLVFAVNKVTKAKMDGRGKVSLEESSSNVHQLGGT